MYGPHRKVESPREVVLRMNAKHADKKALELFAREFMCAATSMSPGTTGLAGGRPSPAPIVKVFSFLIPKSEVEVSVCSGDVDSAVAAGG